MRRQEVSLLRCSISYIIGDWFSPLTITATVLRAGRRTETTKPAQSQAPTRAEKAPKNGTRHDHIRYSFASNRACDARFHAPSAAPIPVLWIPLPPAARGRGGKGSQADLT